MVERRPALTLITHLLLLLGVTVVAFPVYLAWVASTHTASTIAQSVPLPLWPGAHGLDNYALALMGGVGESGSRYPATLPMLGVSLASALIIALGKIAISLLSAFASGELDILVGTQMIAKGLHFENVTLVGVIYADLSLHIPDFRAGERTFQLLTQVAGRAGRGDVEGEVFVQSFTPVSKKSLPSVTAGLVPVVARSKMALTPSSAIRSGYCCEVAPMTPSLTVPPEPQIVLSCLPSSARSPEALVTLVTPNRFI